MSDMTFSAIERLQPNISEADDTLRMDQETFCALYERTARPLWVYLWRKTGDSQLADDLLQETYYRFLRTRGVSDDERHRKNYLFRIATNLVHDNWRRHREYEPLSEDHERMSTASDPNIDLERAMAQLEPRQRDALWLAYAEGSSHEEIASILGMKGKSVKSTLFRARRKLARLLRGRKS